MLLTALSLLVNLFYGFNFEFFSEIFGCHKHSFIEPPL